mmetsp:Transcript_5317/g.10164  ORF Transcript_5317/g.10164 Transcript_5317/m.10164 type:complete len:117 (+) Transcript_5317:166-516(+)|eukprot:CAMPEP_0178703350 /NCGR_PEP_ID=MMETSP0699-20121125/13486_1 /TAXON_ID=265572 /ORGANISM="Extubocellulus spinifer, Strain CCMP396" /LENGTH=116 /DNA_ID=CAMNT_0020350397 /DNA_START=135 /DNA_END=485 /DNA_ORIENTATION=-
MPTNQNQSGASERLRELGRQHAIAKCAYIRSLEKYKALRDGSDSGASTAAAGRAVSDFNYYCAVYKEMRGRQRFEAAVGTLGIGMLAWPLMPKSKREARIRFFSEIYARHHPEGTR